MKNIYIQYFYRIEVVEPEDGKKWGSTAIVNGTKEYILEWFIHVWVDCQLQTCIKYYILEMALNLHLFLSIGLYVCNASTELRHTYWKWCSTCTCFYKWVCMSAMLRNEKIKQNFMISRSICIDKGYFTYENMSWLSSSFIPTIRSAPCAPFFFVFLSQAILSKSC